MHGFTLKNLITIPEVVCIILSFYELNYYTFPVVVRSILRAPADAYDAECIKKVITLYGNEVKRKMGYHPNFPFLVSVGLLDEVTAACSEIVGQNNMDRNLINADHKVFRLEIARDFNLTITYKNSETGDSIIMPKVNLARFPNLRELVIPHITPLYAMQWPKNLKYLELTADYPHGVETLPEGLETLCVTNTIYNPQIKLPRSLKRLIVRKPLKDHYYYGNGKVLLCFNMVKFGEIISEALGPFNEGDTTMINSNETYDRLIRNHKLFLNLKQYDVRCGDVNLLVARNNTKGNFVATIAGDVVDFSRCNSASINRIIVRGDVRRVILPPNCCSLRDLRIPDECDLVMPKVTDKDFIFSPAPMFPCLRICRVGSVEVFNKIDKAGAPSINKLKLRVGLNKRFEYSSEFLSRLKLTGATHRLIKLNCPRLTYLWTNIPEDADAIINCIPHHLNSALQRNLILYTTNHWADREWYSPVEEIILPDVHDNTNKNIILSNDEFEALKANICI